MLLAVLLAATQVVGSLLLAPLHPDRAVPNTPMAAALLLAAPVVLVATRGPVIRAVVATAAASAYLASGYPVGPVLIGAGAALVLAVLAGRHAEAWLVAGAGLVAAVVAAHLGGAGAGLPALPAIQWAGWVVGLLALAELVRARRDADQVWSRARAQVRLRQAGEERVAVARDRQDEAIQQVQLIRVGAGAVLPLLEIAPDDAAAADQLELARAALAAVRDAGDRALTELRAVDELLALRGEAGPGPVVGPGLAGLTALAERWAAVGLLVRAAGNPGPLPPDTDLVALRVIQEALANVARHSCATHADIALHREVDQLTVLVSDPGPALGDPDPPWNGRGLGRLHERVGALGGAASAGPDGDGWCVHVVLPAAPAG